MSARGAPARGLWGGVPVAWATNALTSALWLRRAVCGRLADLTGWSWRAFAAYQGEDPIPPLPFGGRGVGLCAGAFEVERERVAVEIFNACVDEFRGIEVLDG